MKLLDIAKKIDNYNFGKLLDTAKKIDNYDFRKFGDDVKGWYKKMKGNSGCYRQGVNPENSYGGKDSSEKYGIETKRSSRELEGNGYGDEERNMEEGFNSESLNNEDMKYMGEWFNPDLIHNYEKSSLENYDEGNPENNLNENKITNLSEYKGKEKDTGKFPGVRKLAAGLTAFAILTGANPAKVDSLNKVEYVPKTAIEQVLEKSTDVSKAYTEISMIVESSPKKNILEKEIQTIDKNRDRAIEEYGGNFEKIILESGKEITRYVVQSGDNVSEILEAYKHINGSSVDSYNELIPDIDRVTSINGLETIKKDGIDDRRIYPGDVIYIGEKNVIVSKKEIDGYNLEDVLMEGEKNNLYSKSLKTNPTLLEKKLDLQSFKNYSEGLNLEESKRSLEDESISLRKYEELKNLYLKGISEEEKKSGESYLKYYKNIGKDKEKDSFMLYLEEEANLFPGIELESNKVFNRDKLKDRLNEDLYNAKKNFRDAKNSFKEFEIMNAFKNLFGGVYNSTVAPILDATVGSIPKVGPKLSSGISNIPLGVVDYTANVLGGGDAFKRVISNTNVKEEGWKGFPVVYNLNTDKYGEEITNTNFRKFIETVGVLGGLYWVGSELLDSNGNVVSDDPIIGPGGK